MLECEDKILWAECTGEEIQLDFSLPFCKLIRITEGGVAVMQRAGG